ncbi:MAG TPA: hypothetical protein PKZ76_09465 [Xanthomonadaceae bacterium]|nr:hypothetical protein [Xanthomonadaceae bacterium]
MFIRFAMVATLLALLLPGCTSRPEPKPITLDETVQGELGSLSSKADDFTPYDLYLFRGEPGQRIRITMRSEQFDAFLAVGSVAAPGCSDDCRSDDDSGGGLDASLVYTLPASGEVQIRANAIEIGARGKYSLSVAALPSPRTAQARAVRLGIPMEGTLGDESARDDDDRPYDLWSIEAAPGTRLRIRHNSRDFDAYLEYGAMVGDRFTAEASDDDGGSDLNARLDVVLGESGRALIKTTSVSNEASGRYTLLVADPSTAPAVSVAALALGEAVKATLDDDDAYDDDNSAYFDAYAIQGQPGQRVTVRMDSSDFDPLLRWGRFEGAGFAQDLMDDDSGGGSSAQFTVTLDADGLGRVLATSFGEGRGSYTLTAVVAARP